MNEKRGPSWMGAPKEAASMRKNRWKKKSGCARQKGFYFQSWLWTSQGFLWHSVLANPGLFQAKIRTRVSPLRTRKTGKYACPKLEMSRGTMIKPWFHVTFEPDHSITIIPFAITSKVQMRAKCCVKIEISSFSHSKLFSLCVYSMDEGSVYCNKNTGMHIWNWINCFKHKCMDWISVVSSFLSKD